MGMMGMMGMIGIVGKGAKIRRKSFFDVRYNNALNANERIICFGG